LKQKDNNKGSLECNDIRKFHLKLEKRRMIKEDLDNSTMGIFINTERRWNCKAHGSQ